MKSIHTVLFIIIIIICLYFSYHVLNKQYMGLKDNFQGLSDLLLYNRSPQCESNNILGMPQDEYDKYMTMLMNPAFSETLGANIKILIATMQQPNLSNEAKELYIKLIQGLQANKFSNDVFTTIQKISAIMQKESIPDNVKKLFKDAGDLAKYLKSVITTNSEIPPNIDELLQRLQNIMAQQNIPDDLKKIYRSALYKNLMAEMNNNCKNAAMMLTPSSRSERCIPTSTSKPSDTTSVPTTADPTRSATTAASSPMSIKLEVKPNNVPFMGNDVSGSFTYYIKQGTDFLFNTSLMNTVFWILVLYVFVHYFIAIVSSRNVYTATEIGELQYSRIIDFTLLGIISLGAAYFYSTLKESDKNNLMGFMIQWTYDFFDNPWGLVEATVFTFVFFLIVYLLNTPTGRNTRPVLIHLVEQKIWIFFAIFIMVAFFKYVLNIPILDYLLKNPVTQSVLKSPLAVAKSSSPSHSVLTTLTEKGNSFYNWIKCGLVPSDPKCKSPSTSAKPTSPYVASSENAKSSPEAVSPTNITEYAKQIEGRPTSADATTAATTATTAATTSVPGASNASISPSFATSIAGSSPGGIVYSSPNVVCKTVTTPSPFNEVFNVEENKYTYEEAREVCQSYGARLATYDEIEDSYKTGGEWCNYGWSDDQMILFPTQKDTWKSLQSNPETQNVCGRPGINGGFVDKPYLKFGANCYGVKPPPPQGWQPFKLDDAESRRRKSGSPSPAPAPSPSPTVRTDRLNSYNIQNWSRFKDKKT
jgi:Extracellular link domain